MWVMTERVTTILFMTMQVTCCLTPIMLMCYFNTYTHTHIYIYRWLLSLLQPTASKLFNYVFADISKGESLGFIFCLLSIRLVRRKCKITSVGGTCKKFQFFTCTSENLIRAFLHKHMHARERQMQKTILSWITFENFGTKNFTQTMHVQGWPVRLAG